MRVWRVANAWDLTKGPYGHELQKQLDRYNAYNDSNLDWCDFEYQTDNTPRHRPCPYGDNLPDVGEDEYFAFESVAHFLNWFDSVDDRRRLDEVGYALYELEVPDELVRKGWRQVVFDIDSAEIVTKHTLEGS